MADSKNITKLDEKLIDAEIVDASMIQDYKKVHTFLNSHVRRTGKILTEETFEIGNTELRQWLMLLYKKGASQEKLTSYLRVGLAHLCYDFVESTYSRIEKQDLITRALLSFKNRKFHKAFFKVASTEAKESARGKKEIKAKKKAESTKNSAKKAKPSTKATSSAKKKTPSRKTAPKKKMIDKTKSPKKDSKKVEKKEKGFFSFFKK